MAFTFPGPVDRVREHAPHARFITPSWCHGWRRSFRSRRSPPGAACSAPASARSRRWHGRALADTYGSLLLQSGSFVFTDIGDEHGGGPVFDPVVKFTNRYRERPTRVATASSRPAGCTSG